MFTGIIQHVGIVRDTRKTPEGMRLIIDTGPLATGLGIGDSMSVNGVCLTACSINGSIVEFDAVSETVDNTTTGKLRSASRVNLEPAMPVSGRFDGHIVQGHVDGTASVRRILGNADWRVEFAADTELLRQMVPRGSVAIDGVSLTLAELGEDFFAVALIPTTLADTTLCELAEGREVNIETDILGKYIRRTLQQLLRDGEENISGGLTIEKLRESGFA